MIVKLNGGGQIILTECHWVPGAYLSASNMRDGQGVIIKPAELDKLVNELTRIRAAIAERAEANLRRKERKVA